MLGGPVPSRARGSAARPATTRARPGANSSATQRGGAGDQPVEQHRRAPHRGLDEAESGEHRQVRPARHAQQGERVVDVRAGAAQRVADRGRLAHPGLVVDPAPAPDDRHRLRAGDRRDEHRGRASSRRPRSTPARAGPRPSRPPRRRARGPTSTRALGLLVGQRVRRGRCARCRTRRGSAGRERSSGGGASGSGRRDVHHPHGRPGHRARARRPARCGRGSPTTWALRDVGRVGGDPGRGDAVVGDDEHDPRPGGRPRRARALRGGEPAAQLGEPAQRAGGYRELGVPGDRRAAGLGVRRGHLGEIHAAILRPVPT